MKTHEEPMERGDGLTGRIADAGRGLVRRRQGTEPPRHQDTKGLEGEAPAEPRTRVGADPPARPGRDVDPRLRGDDEGAVPGGPAETPAPAGGEGDVGAGLRPAPTREEKGVVSQPSVLSTQYPVPPPTRRRRADFVARTIVDITATLEHAVFSEEFARIPGLLQRLDARAKVVAALILLIVVALARHIELLVAISALSLLLVRLSRLSVSGFARRVWLGVPLFTGMIAFPSLFLAPGRPLLVVLDSPYLRLVLTDAGLFSALLLVARVGASVSIALLLVSTTRWADLLRALSVLRVPQSFLMVLAMTYRYLFLFLRSASNLLLARRSRTVGVTVGAEQRRWAATATGTLVSRSVKLSGDVLLAMRARGFDGEIRTLGGRPLRDVDWLLLSATIALSAMVLLLDRSLG